MNKLKKIKLKFKINVMYLNKFFVFFSSFLLMSCTSQKLKLGKSAPIDSKLKESKIYIPDSRYLICETIKIDGIEYKIGINDSKKVDFIFTNDLEFKIDDKKVNGELNIEKFSSSIEEIPGWGKFVYLNKGWYALLDNNDKSKFKIISFFKFNFNSKKSNLSLKTKGFDLKK